MSSWLPRRLASRKNHCLSRDQAASIILTPGLFPTPKTAKTCSSGECCTMSRKVFTSMWAHRIRPIIRSRARSTNRGWCGVNIEPATGYFEKLCAERPRDLTLQVALGNREGWARLHEFPDTGLSTLVEGVAAGHQTDGFKWVERRVPLLTLAGVWQKFVNGEVHFLKIDVEGYERQVLSGADLARFRPWIILVEAAKPRTSEANWEEWDQILVRARYQLVHFDGLNRWYLAGERSYLKARFEAPPNVFDRFRLADLVSFHSRALKAEFTVKQMQSSASWRITAPLRKVKDALCAAADCAASLAQKAMR